MKEQIRGLVTSFGADLCGFAGIGQFSNAPAGFGPRDIYPECETVISFAVALPKGLGKINPRLIYARFSDSIKDEADDIAFKSAKEIEKRFGGVAVPLPCDTPYEYWDSERVEGKGLMSMRHAAVQAGLGSLGKSGLLLNRRFGNMLTPGAILTSLRLPPDGLCESVCIEGCNRCVEACPAKAIGGGTVNQKLCRENTYGKTARGFGTVDCNRCRTVCPINDIANDSPA